MAHPFQSIAISSPRGSPTALLLAASGSQILTFSLSTRTLASTWPPRNNIANSAPVVGDDGEDGRPGKRQKLSTEPETHPYVLTITASHSGDYLVALTAEDKAVRVFEVGQSGELKELSKRCLFKRPSTIDLSDDDSTIFVGDKFGDVYSLPLLPSADWVPKQRAVDADRPSGPSASVTTVHTAANRKILEAQIKAKDGAKPKEGLPFEHELVLGHVSLLTDVKFATVEGENGNRRTYLLSADRDEHIRISRGPPQTYVIENFCLGHKEFVSKLCFIAGGRYLVSGGGDDELFIWDWLSSKLIRRVDLRGPFEAVVGTGSGSSDTAAHSDRTPITVTGLWRAVIRDSECILVACEGVAAIFVLSLGLASDDAASSPTVSYTALPGNLLDVTMTDDGVIVSVDGLHMENSTSQVREAARGQQLRILQPQEDGATFDVVEFFTNGAQEAGPSGGAADTKAAERLYATGLLRKRRHDGEGDDMAGE